MGLETMVVKFHEAAELLAPFPGSPHMMTKKYINS